jgi:hypothetical protein
MSHLVLPTAGELTLLRLLRFLPSRAEGGKKNKERRVVLQAPSVCSRMLHLVEEPVKLKVTAEPWWNGVPHREHRQLGADQTVPST